MSKFAIALLLLASCSFAFDKSSCLKKIADPNQNGVFAEFSADTSNTDFQAIILPATGGETILDRKLARNLCGLGITSIVYNYSQAPQDPLDLDHHDRASLEFLTQLDSFLAKRGKPVVLIGASLGGLYASMAFGFSQTILGNRWPGMRFINGAILTVAGGTLPDILATSDLPPIVSERNLRKAKYEIGDDGVYVKLMSEHIKFDPLGLANSKYSARVLMFSSTNDTSVPTPTQYKLWEAWGKPKREIASFGHAGTAIYFYTFHVSQMFDFISSIPQGR